MFWRRRIAPVRVGGELDDACAVLTMIARHFGRDVTPPEVDAFLTQVAEDPALDRSAMDLVHAAAELGLIAHGLQLSHPAGFGELRYPCIGHVIRPRAAFVVLEARAGQQLSIIDPYEGVRTREPADILFARSSGVVLVFEPGQALPPARLL